MKINCISFYCILNPLIYVNRTVLSVASKMFRFETRKKIHSPLEICHSAILSEHRISLRVKRYVAFKRSRLLIYGAQQVIARDLLLVGVSLLSFWFNWKASPTREFTIQTRRIHHISYSISMFNCISCNCNALHTENRTSISNSNPLDASKMHVRLHSRLNDGNRSLKRVIYAIQNATILLSLWLCRRSRNAHSRSRSRTPSRRCIQPHFIFCEYFSILFHFNVHYVINRTYDIVFMQWLRAQESIPRQR